MTAALAGLIGGIGLFLLGMGFMTDGLKLAAGSALKQLLDRWTRSPLRGLLAGALITALVQSSSAVTFATIGFVNAGLLSLTHAVWVIFGTNVGTSTTGWLVALLGVKLDIGSFALPLIGFGMLMRLTGGARPLQVGLGQALTGFGLFFLGVGVLQAAFAGLVDDVTDVSLGVEGVAAIAVFLGVGVVLAVLTQSSSAAIAIALTASAGAGLPLFEAAAVVIGATIGTTSTALFASLGATAAARRVAMAHIAFNLVTGAAALALMQPLLALAQALADRAGAGGDDPTVLAVFHTTYKVLGVALMVPLSRPMVRWLGRRFVTPAEEIARPRHLDATLARLPSLALEGLVLETARMEALALGLARRRLLGAVPAARNESAGLLALGEAIRSHLGLLGREALSAPVADALPHVLRCIQHLESLARDSAVLPPPDRGDAALREAVRAGLDRAAEGGIAVRAGAVEEAYQTAKARLLRDAANGRITIHALDSALADAQTLRGCGMAALKAQRRLQSARAAAAERAETVPAVLAD